MRLWEQSARQHTESGCLLFEADWLEPKARLRCRAPPPPAGPGVGRLFPLMLWGAAGEWTEGVSGYLLSSVISHHCVLAWMRRRESSIHHLLPTQQLLLHPPLQPALGAGKGDNLPHPKAVREVERHSCSSHCVPQSPWARGRRIE